MTPLDFTRSFIEAFHLDPELVAEKMLWAAGESQKATAIPALTAFAALALLVVVLWLGAVGWVFRRVR